MRKSSVILSLCAGVLLASSLCVNVLLYQRVSSGDRKPGSGREKPVPAKGKKMANNRLRPVVRAKRPLEDLICTEAFGRLNDDSPGICLRFNHWDMSSTENQALIQIRPAVPFRLSATYGGLELYGDFKYEKEYTVFLKKGMRSRRGAVLKYDCAFKVKMPALPPEARFVSSGTIFPSGRKDLFLPLELINLKALHVKVYELYENNLTRYEQSYWEPSQSGKGRLICEKTLSVQVPRNTVFPYKLKLADLIKGGRSGVYSVEVRYDKSYRCIARVINLTDLACTISLDKISRKAAVAVCSLKDNTAAVNASVMLISEKHQLLACGKTGPSGIVLLDYSRSLAGRDKEDSPEYLLVRSAEGSITLLRNLVHKSHSLAPFLNQGKEYKNQVRAFIYTERGIYRGSEEVCVNLWLRDRINRVYADKPCLVKVLDPRGNTVFSKVLVSGKSGFASVRFTLPAESRSGEYDICCIPDQNSGDLVWGNTSFLVSDFTPDRIKVQLKSSASSLYKGEKLSFDLNADHYYGVPLTNAPCRFRITAQKAPQNPAWENWSVGDESVFQAGKGDSSSGKVMNGKSKFQYKGFELCGGKAFSPVLLTASAQVRDPGGRTVTARSSVTYHPFDFYIGLRTGKDPAQRQAVVEWKLLSSGKKAVDAKTLRSLKVTLHRLEWHSVTRRLGSNLRLDWEQRKVYVPEALTLLKTSDLQGTWKRELESGQYEITVEDSVRRSVLNFYHWRGDDSPRSSNPAVIHCFADKKLYKGGEEALLTFRSPGEGVLLLTGADPRLVFMKSVKVKAGENTVRIRIPENVPSEAFYCALTLIRGEKRQFALVCLKVDQSAKKLKVDLACPEKVVPGEKVKVQISLKDAAGKSISGAVQLFAVEEGILALTGYQTPDIFRFFFGKYRCGLFFADVYSTLYPELKINSSGRFGGDAVAAKAMSANGRFRNEAENDPSRYAPESVVLLLPVQNINGSGSVTFTVPDYLGSLRLMAVASSSSAVGSNARNVVVRTRADLEIAGPRVCAPSDSVELTFTLLNSDIPGGTGVFRVKLPSGKFYTEPVKVLPGKSRVLRLTVQMPSVPGICTIPCELTLGNRTRKKVFRCGVRLPSPLVRQTALRMLKGGERFPIGKVVQSGDFASVKSCTVTLSPSPATALQDGISFLNDYPYGCLEQTVAKAFPFLALKDLTAMGIMTPEMAKGAELKLLRTAGKIHSMMLYSGAFPMWQGMEEPWISGSIFAAHFLCESKRFEADSRRRCRTYLRSVASRKSNTRYERAYAVYVLSLMKDPVSVKYARDLLDPAKDDFASLLAAFTLLERNYAGEGAAHLGRLLKKGVFMDDTVPHFTCEVSRKGMILYLLSKYAVERSSREKLALELTSMLRKDGSGWGVTHANSWAVLGLASFLREQGTTGSGKVRIRESAGVKGTLQEVAARGIALPVKKEFFQTFEVENISSSPVFVRLCVEGRLRTAQANGNGLTLKRRYLNARGKEVTGASQGDLLTVELTVCSSGPLKDLVLSDMLPGGLEIEDDALKTRMKLETKYDRGVLKIKHVEKRSGELVLCADLSGKGTGRFLYQVRAVTRGKFAPARASAEGMYDPGTFARTGTEQKVFEIR